VVHASRIKSLLKDFQSGLSIQRWVDRSILDQKIDSEYDVCEGCVGGGNFFECREEGLPMLLREHTVKKAALLRQRRPDFPMDYQLT
jgi:hypothetical protein